jgi:hexosaminidase
MQLVPMLRKHNKQLMGWEEIMTKDMSKSAIIHSWKGNKRRAFKGSSLVAAAKMVTKQFYQTGIILI